MTELKPCPFCGYETICEMITLVGCSVYCARCFAKVQRKKENGAYKTLEIAKRIKQKETRDAWNRRVDNDR
jgi:hypothetical protein